MACLPIALHASVSCMLGLGYGCGYITSLATYEIFNRRKKQNTSDNTSDNTSKQIEFIEKKVDENIVNPVGCNTNNVGNNYTINDLLNTLDEVKTELQYTREKLELFDHKLEDSINSNKNVEKDKSKRYRTLSF